MICTGTGLEALGAKNKSPVYSAVIECSPAARVVTINVAAPEVIVADPIGVDPSKNSTVPPGTASNTGCPTVAVRVIGRPVKPGFGVTWSWTFVIAGLMTWVTTFDVLEVKAPPPK